MENFKITKVTVQVLHRIEKVNNKWLPAYSELVKSTVHFVHNDEKYTTKIYHLISEPIDIECSVKEYYRLQRDYIEEEIFDNCTAFDEIKKYKREQLEGILLSLS